MDSSKKSKAKKPKKIKEPKEGKKNKEPKEKEKKLSENYWYIYDRKNKSTSLKNFSKLSAE
jgi:hypothetical protein